MGNRLSYGPGMGRYSDSDDPVKGGPVTIEPKKVLGATLNKSVNRQSIHKEISLPSKAVSL